MVFFALGIIDFRIMPNVSPGLVAALSSWLFLQEALILSQWAGVLAILGTGVLVGLTEKAAES